MKIGYYKVNLKNKSKNQRKYLKEVKRLFDEITSQDIELDPIELIELFETNKGKVTKDILNLLNETGVGRKYKIQKINNNLFRTEHNKTINAETGEILDDDDQYYRIQFQNFINLLPTHPNTTTRRGRQRKLTKGEKEGIALANALIEIANKYGYRKAVAVINKIPQDIRNKIVNGDAAARYKSCGDALAFIETIDLNKLDEEFYFYSRQRESNTEDYDDYEEYE